MINFTDINEVRKILSEYDFNFSKSLGQNFLIDSTVCPRMAEICGASDECGVIEIGTGIGTLTSELAKKGGKVVTMEVDKKLYPIIDNTLANFDNIKVLHQDAMKSDLKKIIAEEFEGKDVAVCANLPYYITSPILMFMLESNIEWKNITVMIQKEVADRICAEPGKKNTGAITYAIRYYGKAEKCFTVPSGSFVPPPKVNSSVMKITPDNSLRELIDNPKTYFSLVKAGFAQRRKRFTNSVSANLGIDRETITDILKKLEIDENVRIEQMTAEEVASVANEINRIK